MNPSWRGGLLLILLAVQEPAPPPPDPVARYSEILANGLESRRDLAARALLSLGRPGYDALRKILAADPAIAKTIPAPGEPPGVALVRIPRTEKDDKTWREALELKGSMVIEEFPVAAERVLWETLEAPDLILQSKARFLLRRLYAVPPEPVAPVPSIALRKELHRRRTFDVSDRSLADVLAGEPISWIVMAPRKDRITLKLRDASLSEFLRIAVPDLAAVPVNDLLLMIPPDRVASVTPPPAVWASADLAPKLESALRELARGESGPVKALTGIPVYYALRRCGDLNAEAKQLADDVRMRLQQRVFFTGDDLAGPAVTLEPKGRRTGEVLEEFERISKRPVAVRSQESLDLLAPEFKFHAIPAEQAARALEFRLNYLR